MIMWRGPKLLLIGYPILAALLLAAAEPPELPAGAIDSPGPRVLEKQTRASVTRDYLQAWQSLGRAFSENQPDVLSDYFVGVARDKLADTVHQQQNLGIQTVYGEPTHDFEIAFYSPDGLSVQLVDKVAYRLDILDHGRVVGSRQVHARYVAVMTPAENKWKVRVFQAEPQ